MPNSNIFVAAMTAALLILVHVGAADDAKPEAPNLGAMFAELDTNHDGQLAAEEVPAEKRRLFERLLRMADADNNGRLSSDEFIQGLKPAERPKSSSPAAGESAPDRPQAEGLFPRLDANHDGKVKPDEVPEARREGFKRLLARGDKDGDGGLNRQEFGNAMRDFAPPDGERDPKQLFRRLDKNGDGKLTADEVPQDRPMLVRLLKRGDKDGDHALSIEEFSKVLARRPQ